MYADSKNKKREFSSAGSEHLPYKQRVTGSNPVTPTLKINHLRVKCKWFFMRFTKKHTKIGVNTL